jgi:membrane-associated phospholipid phosphatase
LQNKKKHVQMKYFLLFFSFIVLPNTLTGQVLLKDSVSLSPKQKDPFWKYTIAPAVLGGLSVATWHSRENVRVVRNRYIPDFHNDLDNYLQYTPAVTAFALNLSGVKGRNKFGRAVVNWGGGMLIMGGLVNSLKYSAKVTRPDGAAMNSFPSGHTATAFMNASFLHKEYGHINPLYGILGYSMATYTGISRSLNNRHWVSDILAGAGIGVLATELSYLIVDNFYKNKGDFFTSFDVKNEVEKPSFVSVRFGQTFYMDGLKSFEKIGLEGTIEGAYFLNKKWGIGGELGFMHLPFRSAAMEWDELPEDIANPQTDVQSFGFPTLMVGGYYSKIFGRMFILQGKILAGIGAGIGGDIDLRAEYRTGEKWEETTIHLAEYTADNTWVIGGGASLTMMVAPTLGLALYADYKYAYPKIKVSVSEYYRSEDEYPSDSRMTLSALSAGLKLVSFF